MARGAAKTDWAASVEAIVRRAPKPATTRDALSAQIRLLALLGSAAPLNVLLSGLAIYVETWADGLLCSVLLVDPSGRQLRPGAAPSLPPAYVQAIDPVPIQSGHGSCGTAAAQREMVIVEDVERSDLWTAYAATAVTHGLRACWSMPVFDDATRLLATLAIYCRRPRKPSPQEIDLIQFAALLAASVIQRHRDAERLRASEARLGAAVWATEIGLWECSADGVARWFDAWPRRFGIEPDCENGTLKQWCERMHPDDVGRYDIVSEPCLRTGVDHYLIDYRMRAPNDRWRWVHERGRVTARASDGTPTGYVGMCIDIDAQRTTAAALREGEARLEAAVGGSDIGLWDWEAGTDSLAWLSDWPRRKGINSTADRTTMADLMAVAHPLDRQRLVHDVDVVIGPGRDSIETEYRFLSLRGEYRWLQARARVVERDSRGRAKRVVGACIDVDQRRRAEEQLRTQAKILETMNEGVVLIDLAGRIEHTNRAFERMFGRAPGQHIGKSILSLLTDSSAERLEPLAEDRLLKRFTERSELFDVLFRRADGTEFTGEVISEAIGLASGQKWLLVVWDVSERKQLEREILDISNRERRQLGNDLHDGLGQELTGVALMLRSVATQLRRDSPTAAPQIDEIVGLVNHAIASTRAMAHGLMPVTLDHGGLGSALAELTSRARVSYGIEVRFRRSIPADLQIDENTANNLYRITQEAINNSIRHGHPGTVLVNLRAHAGKLELSVNDDGVGFVDGPDRIGGMGLKIMKYRAQVIGGTIKIEPRRSGGTRVKCVCPAGPLKKDAPQGTRFHAANDHQLR